MRPFVPGSLRLDRLLAVRVAPRSPRIALWAGLVGLGCAAQEPAGVAEGSTAAQTPASDSGLVGAPTPSSTGAPPSAGSTGGTTAAADSSAGMADTLAPPSFDLGVPDMPPPVDPPVEEFDCNDVPDPFVSYRPIPGPRGYHGLAITPDGLMIGSDDSSLIESTYEGEWGVFIPGASSGQQMDWLADGDLAHATGGGIIRIRLDGTTDTLAPGITDAYGLIRGIDDRLYLGKNYGSSAVDRLDPVTGASELLFQVPSGTAHSLEFSPDSSRMYVGTIGDGVVYFVDLDDALNPISAPEVLSAQVGQGNGWHDAVAVDACGNLYVPDFYSRNIYRVRPDGTTTLYWQPDNNADYAHGLIWGTGEHGWRRDALYFPQPYNGNTVGELVVGAPPREFDGIVLNAPPGV